MHVFTYGILVAAGIIVNVNPLRLPKITRRAPELLCVPESHTLEVDTLRDPTM
jgi:hypothetical protein